MKMITIFSEGDYSKYNVAMKQGPCYKSLSSHEGVNLVEPISSVRSEGAPLFPIESYQ